MQKGKNYVWNIWLQVQYYHATTSIEVESYAFEIEGWCLAQMFYIFEFEFDILLVEIDPVACGGPHLSEAGLI